MSTPPPERRLITDAVVRVSDLTVVEDVIHDVDFLRCHILGPAVLVPLEAVEIVDTGFGAPGPEELFWPLSSDRPALMGAVGLLRVSFRGCRLERIGIGVPADQLEATAANIEF